VRQNLRSGVLAESGDEAKDLHGVHRTQKHDSETKEAMKASALAKKMYEAYRESYASEDVEIEDWDLIPEQEQRAWETAAHRALFLLETRQ
jgi:hypothetical protein